MASLKDRPQNTRFMGLFVGPSGDGKKCAAISFNKLGSLKYLDFDMRIDGAYGAKDWVNFDGIDYESYPPKASVTLFERLNKDLEELYQSLRVNQCKYKTLVLGSITGVAAGLLADSLNITSTNVGGGKREISRMLGPLKIATMENYKFINNGVKGVMSFLQSLPINIIVLAHTVPIWDSEDENDPYSEKKVVGHKLNLSDNLGAEVPSKFSNVFRFERKITGAGAMTKTQFNVEFRGQFAKTTFTELPDRMDITRKNFYNEVMEYKKNG